jgi:hypothetical protein
MSTVHPFSAGGYRFISHQFEYSGEVAAEPGFRIERARFTRPVPLADGSDAIEAYLAGIGRSPTAFCACELSRPRRPPEAAPTSLPHHVRSKSMPRCSTKKALWTFAALRGPEFYRLPANSTRVKLCREPSVAPVAIGEGANALVPFRASETLRWRLVD